MRLCGKRKEPTEKKDRLESIVVHWAL